MELTSRVYRRLRLICGNIAKILTPASFRRSVSGLVERWVSTNQVVSQEKVHEIMMYSLKTGAISDQLNEKIRTAYKLGYNPEVVVKKHFLAGDVPLIYITFSPPSEHDKTIGKISKKCL